MTRIKWTAEYPRPWWRRLLGLRAKRAHIFTGTVEPWPGNYVGQTPPGGTTNPTGSGATDAAPPDPCSCTRCLIDREIRNSEIRNSGTARGDA